MQQGTPESVMFDYKCHVILFAGKLKFNDDPFPPAVQVAQIHPA